MFSVFAKISICTIPLYKQLFKKNLKLTQAMCKLQGTKYIWKRDEIVRKCGMNSNSYEKFTFTSIFSLINKSIKVPLFLENFNAIILEMNGKESNISGNYRVVNIFNSLDSSFQKMALKLSVLDYGKNEITFDKDSHNISR